MKTAASLVLLIFLVPFALAPLTRSNHHTTQKKLPHRPFKRNNKAFTERLERTSGMNYLIIHRALMIEETQDNR